MNLIDSLFILISLFPLFLKSYLDKSFSTPFYIETDNNINNTAKKSKIYLEIRNSKKLKEKNSFLIKSDENSIFLLQDDVYLSKEEEAIGVNSDMLASNQIEIVSA